MHSGYKRGLQFFFLKKCPRENDFEKGIEGRNRSNQVAGGSGLYAFCLWALLDDAAWEKHSCVYSYDAFGLDLLLVNSLIDMYGKCGSLKIAIIVVDWIKKVNWTSWSPMINCFALYGQTEGAFGVITNMLLHGDEVKPDGVTFIGLLNACTS
ncbi:unnamed protein product [Fraxinus pennsylvanica]|uniref:Pentatricopeptide repeat-containing protein n=1 Tax=Fraxinus pennsylvanica TaxID=56036 RepID=A0AAD1ZT12_9LAMI|nr:unnamed protein product [Fraxinus pennsylvanica]